MAALIRSTVSRASSAIAPLTNAIPHITVPNNNCSYRSFNTTAAGMVAYTIYVPSPCPFLRGITLIYLIMHVQVKSSWLKRGDCV